MSMFVPRWRAASLAAVCMLALALSSIASAQLKVSSNQSKDTSQQPNVKPEYANFFMSSSVGSFKMLEYNDDHQPEGHFEMNFTGTVLVDTTEAVKHNRGLTTSIKTEGNVILALDFHGRKVYHGTGKLILDGGWHALQFFGRDLTAKFNGYAVFRLEGEFDKNLETGYYWYDDGKKVDWGTGGNQPTVPQVHYGASSARVRINGKGG